jgi:hypothetical protein
MPVSNYSEKIILQNNISKGLKKMIIKKFNFLME